MKANLLKNFSLFFPSWGNNLISASFFVVSFCGYCQSNSGLTFLFQHLKNVSLLSGLCDSWGDIHCHLNCFITINKLFSSHYFYDLLSSFGSLPMMCLAWICLELTELFEPTDVFMSCQIVGIFSPYKIFFIQNLFFLYYWY